jgi:deoxyribodipyrimidine photolyase-related protein
MTAPTIWVLGDQLDAEGPAFAGHRAGEARVLMVESRHAVERLPFNRERRVLVIGAMRRFADRLRREGWAVDLRQAPTFAAGVLAHCDEHRPDRLVVAHPSSRAGLALTGRLRSALPVPVEVRDPVGFITRPGEMDDMLRGRQPRMATFYREMRLRLGLLVDDDGAPTGGEWSFDQQNRRPPPKSRDLGAPPPWLPPAADPLDVALRKEFAGLPETGAGGERVMAATADEAEMALERFVQTRLDGFGPFQDAMMDDDWAMSHAFLSGPLNLGLLSPRRVAERVAEALGDGAPIQSVEGFVRQVIGWREYVWGWYWRRDWQGANALEADAPVPAALMGAGTRMRCVQVAADGVEERGYTHHIQRLMILGTLMLQRGTQPASALRWFRASHVDAAAWVMAPNVLGMALFADGGQMMSKPYAASGAYVKRMSNHCRSCPYDPAKATGPTACPFTTLYWAFLDRHRPVLARNPRMALSLRNLDRRDDLPVIRREAHAVGERLDAGEA